MAKATSVFYILLALFLGLLSIMSVIDLVRAFLFPDTLTAVESSFGTGVLAIILAVMAVNLFKFGLRRFHQAGSR